MKTSETINKIAPALVKAQAAMLPLIKDSNNPFFKSKYADLKAVTAACYPALQENGISIIQGVDECDGVIDVKTRLLHSSGEWIETSCPVGIEKSNAQGYGSAITYGRRYALQAAVGIAPEDDDGNAASKGPAAKKVAKKAVSKDPVTEQQHDNLNSLLNRLYKGDELDEKRKAGASHVSGKRTEDTLQLYKSEAAKLIKILTDKTNE